MPAPLPLADAEVLEALRERRAATRLQADWQAPSLLAEAEALCRESPGSEGVPRLEALLRTLRALRWEVHQLAVPQALAHLLSESGYLAHLLEGGWDAGDDSAEEAAEGEQEGAGWLPPPLRQLLREAEAFAGRLAPPAPSPGPPSLRGLCWDALRVGAGPELAAAALERAGEVAEAAAAACHAGPAPLRDFLGRVSTDGTADPEEGRGGGGGAAVVISTIHAAKGLEWDVVFMPSVNNGALPVPLWGAGPRAAQGHMEEEKRLFHVAATRARDQLHVSFVQPFASLREEGVCLALFSSAPAGDALGQKAWRHGIPRHGTNALKCGSSFSHGAGSRPPPADAPQVSVILLSVLRWLRRQGGWPDCQGLDPALLAYIREQPWSKRECFPGASQDGDGDEREPERGAAGEPRAPAPPGGRTEAAAAKRSALSSIANTVAAAAASGGQGAAGPGVAPLQYKRRKGFKPPRPLNAPA